MFATAMARSATGHVFHELAVGHVVTRERAQPGQRQLPAAFARRRVRGRDQLDAQERLLGLAADELLAFDRPLEVVEQRVEPGDVAGIHPVRRYRFPLETPGSRARLG